MAWQGILGHDDVVARFRHAVQRGRLAGSFLFVGPSGIGKRFFALALARGLLCKGNGDFELDPCGQCESCRLFGSGEFRPPDAPFVSPHPDLYLVSKPADKSLLPLELLIGDKDHRGRSGLCFEISRTPFLGHRKVAILDDADFLNAEGANALLKTLEEPPPDSLLILIGSSTTKQLPTIRSRCRIIRFAPLSSQILSTLLVQQGIVKTPEQGTVLAKRAGGSLDQARELVDDVVDEMRTELQRGLSARRIDAVALAAKLNGFVEKAGKEAPVRRRRLRLLFLLAIDLFREKMKKGETPSTGESTELRQRHESDARLAARQLERTLDAMEQIDRNANLPYIVDAWCVELNA